MKHDLITPSVDGQPTVLTAAEDAMMMAAFPELDAVAASVAADGYSGASQPRPNAHGHHWDERQLAGAISQLIGAREIWTAHSPGVVNLITQLRKVEGHLPVPDPTVQQALSKINGYSAEGKLTIINGVPVPAGEAQIRLFVALRFRFLYSPLAKLHLVGLRDLAAIKPSDAPILGVSSLGQVRPAHLIRYDALHSTEEAQKTLFMYSVADHRDNLISLQRHDLEIFLAVWLRDFAKLRKRLGRIKPCWLVTPHRSSSERSARTLLLRGTAIMSELERLSEIAAEMADQGSVTREAIWQALTASQPHITLPNRHRILRFINGMNVHARCSFYWLNVEPLIIASAAATRAKAKAGKPNGTERLFDAHCATSAYWHNPQRLRKPCGKMPACHFLGIETQFLVSAGIMMMIADLKKIEGDHRRRRKHDRTPSCRSDILVVRLALVIMANISIPWARTMRGKLDGAVSDDEWLRRETPTLIDNPNLLSTYLEDPCALSDADEAFADEDSRGKFTNQIELVRARIDLVPQINQPGWTRGFRFSAWLDPYAEIRFLEKCTRFVGYKKCGMFKNSRAARKQNQGPNATIDLGLARSLFAQQHAVETVQERFRPYLEPLQDRPWMVHHEGANTLPRLLDPDRHMLGKDLRAAYAKLVVRLFPTVNSTNLDPFLNEPLHVPALREMREAARKNQKKGKIRTKSGLQNHRPRSSRPIALGAHAPTPRHKRAFVEHPYVT